jgi:tetratricopeptide (TPR) repeat protein
VCFGNPLTFEHQFGELGGDVALGGAVKNGAEALGAACIRYCAQGVGAIRKGIARLGGNKGEFTPGEFDPFRKIRKPKPETKAEMGDPAEAMDKARREVEKERVPAGADPEYPLHAGKLQRASDRAHHEAVAREAAELIHVTRTRAQIIDRAEQLLMERRDAENLALLEVATDRFPDDPDIRLLAGLSLIPFQPEDAPWHLATAVALDPENAERIARAASVLAALGQLEAAEDYIVRVHELAPQHYRLHLKLVNVTGRIAEARGDDELAEEALGEAFANDPDDGGYALDFARFLADRDRASEALEVIDRALALVDRALQHTSERSKLQQLRETLTSGA